MDKDRNVLISVGQQRLNTTSIGLPGNLKEYCMSFRDFAIRIPRWKKEGFIRWRYFIDAYEWDENFHLN